MLSERPTFLVVLGLCISLLPATSFTQGKIALHGVVRDQTGALVPTASITLYSPDRILDTRSQADGRFQFEGLLPGRYTIEIRSPGFKREVLEGYELTQQPAKPLVIELRVASTADDCGQFSTTLYVRDNQLPTSLTGVVADQPGGSPIRNVRLALYRQGDPAVVAEQITNEKGEFQFSLLPPSRYVLEASGEGYGERTTPPFSVVRHTLTRVNLRLLKAGLVIICQ